MAGVNIVGYDDRGYPLFADQQSGVDYYIDKYGSVVGGDEGAVVGDNPHLKNGKWTGKGSIIQDPATGNWRQKRPEEFNEAEHSLIAIRRELYDDWTETYKPVEDQALSMLDNREERIAENAEEAGETARKRMGANLGIGTRLLSRYGVTDPRHVESLKEKNRTETSKAVADAENRARRTTSDTLDAMETDMISVGRGVQSDAVGSFSAAAQQEAQRRAANKQIKDQNSSGLGGLIVGGIGAGIGTYFGGPAGGAAGYQIGSGVGRAFF